MLWFCLLKSRSTRKQLPAAFGNTEAISEQELKIHEYVLASDQLEGRNLPSRAAFDTAALYVASNLAQWGVEPFFNTSGTNGPLQPYFMPFELAATQVNAAETKASITGPPAPRPVVPGQPPAPPAEKPATVTSHFEYGKDWTMPVNFRGGPPLAAFKVSGNLVFAGNGYVVNKTKTNPFEGLDVKGKIVVVAGVPAELRSAPAG